MRTQFIRVAFQKTAGSLQTLQNHLWSFCFEVLLITTSYFHDNDLIFLPLAFIFTVLLRMNSKTLNCQTDFMLLNGSLKFKVYVIRAISCQEMIQISKIIYNVLLGNNMIQPSGTRHTYDFTLTLLLEGTHYGWPHYYFCRILFVLKIKFQLE